MIITETLKLNSTDFLYSDLEAENFNCSYPIGNGTLGAMIYGSREIEKISLNHDCLWAGGDAPSSPKNGPQTIQRARELIFAGKYREAQNICEENLLTDFNQPYLPAGDLLIDWHDTFKNNDNYQRVLSLEAGTAFVDNDVCRRTYFASNPHNLICIDIKFNNGHRGNATFSLTSQLRNDVSIKNEGIVLTGETPENVVWHGVDNRAPEEGIVEYGNNPPRHYAMVCCPTNHDGKLEHLNGNLVLSNFSRCTLLISIQISDIHSAPLDDCWNSITKHLHTSVSNLFTSHYNDFSQFYNRVKLRLGCTKETCLPTCTEQRILDRHQGQFDTSLDTLLFNVGRYLLICSSRAGSQPANLQGIWNEKVSPPWWSNYTININTQMNYWPAEVCNLSEMHEPMFRFIKELSIVGRETASQMYGTRGWVSHHQTDYRRQTTPVGYLDNKIIDNCSQWALWPMSGPWLCSHLIEHYRFTGDIDFLSDFAWPIMKGAAEFLLDWLVEDTNGMLTTAPSTSPENIYRTPDGQINAVCSGSEMDLAIARDHFSSMLEAAKVIGYEDDSVIQEINAVIHKIPTIRMNSQGRIMEWNEDWEEGDHPHRHISQLFGLFPGNQISTFKTPLLSDAAKKTLDFRGTGGTGWSLVWKAICWARLEDGNHTYHHIENLFYPISSQVFYTANDGGGIYPNMMLACPPMMLEANYGYSALVVEMLVQSHEEHIRLLPSLPNRWMDGSISGIKLRKQIEISMEWENSKVRHLTLQSKIDQNVRLYVNDSFLCCQLKADIPHKLYFQ
ncbi:glycoside hydrolase family 95 protein [Parasalinivibrio latis]|uniref:glycosyl hydrolase family 95 catalytic domain-containing protein n=1 Tax=Parasalinivibrio latis TaxID=2952610 RepID=UPI0030E20D08